MSGVKIILVLLSSVFLLSGCGSHGNRSYSTEDQHSTDGCDGVVLADLTSAVKKSGSHLDTLRRLKKQDSAADETLSSAVPPASSPLTKQVTVSWEGPLESILTALGNIVEYKVEITGNIPPQPVMISLNVTVEPIYKVVENIGWQAGNNVAVIRDDKKHIFKVIYRKG